MELPKVPCFRLDGKRALITGAGRGIGLASATALADAGAEVVLVARSETEISQAAEELRSRGFAAEAISCDVTDHRQVTMLVDQSGPFHVLLNNAGTNRPTPFVEVTEEDFDHVVRLNLRAAFFAAQAVARQLIESDLGGSIINVSSQMGHVGAANRSVYCATKHAVEGMTKAMAIELGPRGIRVNTLCPTFIETPLTRPFLERGSFRAEALAKIKIGRLGVVEDVMGAIVFLASDASSLMTGSAVMIDGGWTAE
jgi:NAD(P)-dependent dehydrogenase (short-subunit alcohol dehydrogenase family)